MVAFQKRILIKLINQLDGLSKIDAYDILHLLEEVLNELSSPIDARIVPNTLVNDHYVTVRELFDPDSKKILEDSCRFLQLFRIGKKEDFVCNVYKKKLLFFCTPTDMELQRFTESNLLKEFRDSPLEIIVKQHLKKHSLMDQNPKSQRLLLMELLDQIEFKQ